MFYLWNSVLVNEMPSELPACFIICDFYRKRKLH